VIEAGESYAGVLQVYAPEPFGADAPPHFRWPDVGGQYRLQQHGAYSAYDHDQISDSEALPREYRVSNAFRLVPTFPQ
jgi:hypothetical protein